MDPSEKDETPMLATTFIQSDYSSDSTVRHFSTRTRSASMSIPSNYMDSSENVNNLVGFTGPLRNERRNFAVQMTGPLHASGNHEVVFQPPQSALLQQATESKIERYPSSIHENGMANIHWPLDDYGGKNEHLLKSGQLGMCNDPYCTTCPTYYNAKGRQKQSRASEIFDAKFHHMFYGDAKGWAKRKCSFLLPYIPGVMNPHALFVQRWNKFFVISCLFAVFLDPLFFFLLSVKQDNKCIMLNWPLTTAMVVLRSMTDFIYLLHILLQFRVAYVAPESRAMGAGDLVDDPKRIAQNYLYGYFIIDVFVVLPLPQIIILLILPHSFGLSGANYAKNLLRAAILVQYIPRLFRFLPFLAGQSATDFFFESAWANFVINLLTYVLVSHVVGSCWYLFALQRVNQCLRDACHASILTNCLEFIDCGHGYDFEDFKKDATWELWKRSEDAGTCFGQGKYDYGIYKHAVILTTHPSVLTRYVYSFYWGLQQICTMAGNQVPTYFVWEVLFVGIGILVFSLLIGNVQNFFQVLGRRRLDMFLRCQDVEKWMSHHRLPEELRMKIRRAERFNRDSALGVNEEMLMEDLPEDLQRGIRRYTFRIFRKVRIFQLLEEPIIDAICERLRTNRYIRGSKILFRGGLVDKMVFVIRGKMESIEDLNVVHLSEGDVCGQELLAWCFEHSSINDDGRRNGISKRRLVSNRLVHCLTNVEAFVLRASDLEEVATHFAKFLRSSLVQGAIRYELPYWRILAARRIQAAWSYRKEKHLRANSLPIPPSYVLLIETASICPQERSDPTGNKSGVISSLPK